jgi:Family of unknown function (DUF6152)
MKWLRTVAVIFGLSLGASTAHAAQMAYDTTNFIVLDGFVKSVDWSGSNLKMVFHSNDGYDGADWTLQGPAPAYLKTMGWNQDAVKAGDRIDTVIYPDKSGTANGQLLRLLLPDYRTLETGPYGSSLMYPPGAIKKTIANVADDPLATLYANTLYCLASDSKPADANHSCRIWINADHTVRILRIKTISGLNPDDSFNLATDLGHWWLENQLGKRVLCTLIDNAPMPHCDTAAMRRKVGDKWTVKVHGANAEWTETWELQQGRAK